MKKGEKDNGKRRRWKKRGRRRVRKSKCGREEEDKEEVWGRGAYRKAEFGAMYCLSLVTK